MHACNFIIYKNVSIVNLKGDQIVISLTKFKFKIALKSVKICRRENNV